MQNLESKSSRPRSKSFETETPKKGSRDTSRDRDQVSRLYHWYTYHKRKVCPARNAHCLKCGLKGHFQAVCPSKKGQSVSACAQSTQRFLCGITSAYPQCLEASLTKVTVRNHQLHALIDSGSKANFINERIAQALDISVSGSACNVSMAQTELKVRVSVSCTADVTIGKRMYRVFHNC